MPPVVYRVTQLLSGLLESLPIGTNLGLFHLLFMMMSGRLLESRGAVIPGLDALGLAPPAVRRAWAALAYGRWETPPLLSRWELRVQAEGFWRPRTHGGYSPVACDLVGFFRPRLRGLTSKHYLSAAGKALPAISVGIAARVGAVGTQRVALPCLLLRADPENPDESALQRRLLAETGQRLAENEALICDAGFPLSQILAAGVPRFVARGPRNFTARRAAPPEYSGRGRPPIYGEAVRPLPRAYRGQPIAATPADREESWHEEGNTLHACFFENLVQSNAKPGAARVSCIVIHDPRYKEPLLLLTNLSATGAVALALYRERWPIEQVPLSGKQMLGAHRQYLFGEESRQRLPELALLSGSILTYVAATNPAVATGFWDRKPKATPGRLRRVLKGATYPRDAALPERIREKASVTAHLPKGIAGHRRRRHETPVQDPLPLAA